MRSYMEMKDKARNKINSNEHCISLFEGVEHGHRNKDRPFEYYMCSENMVAHLPL